MISHGITQRKRDWKAFNDRCARIVFPHPRSRLPDKNNCSKIVDFQKSFLSRRESAKEQNYVNVFLPRMKCQDSSKIRWKKPCSRNLLQFHLEKIWIGGSIRRDSAQQGKEFAVTAEMLSGDEQKMFFLPSISAVVSSDNHQWLSLDWNGHGGLHAKPDNSWVRGCSPPFSWFYYFSFYARSTHGRSTHQSLTHTRADALTNERIWFSHYVLEILICVKYFVKFLFTMAWSHIFNCTSALRETCNCDNETSSA